MTVRFAAARSAAHSPLARVFRRQAIERPANDNGLRSEAFDLSTLEPALRHFARYGLGAAMAARTEAEKALGAGDSVAYARWLGICSTFDRRLAASLERKVAPPIGEAIDAPSEHASR